MSVMATSFGVSFLWGKLLASFGVSFLWGKLLAQAKVTDTTRYSDEGSEISFLEMSEEIKLEL